MEFVFNSDIKQEDPPGAPDFLNASRNFTSQDDIFSDAPSASVQKSIARKKKKAQRASAMAAAAAPVATPVTLQRNTSRRKLPDSFSDIEFNEPPRAQRKRASAGAKVNYVKPVKKNKRKSAKKFEWSWTKAGWCICALLVTRLIFMESGVIDYQSMHNTIEQKQKGLELIRVENAELIKEIHKIKTSPSYQKKLARDHLGVIAKGEYLSLIHI